MANETNQFGLWQPWQPEEVAKFFSTLTVPWWIAGGWALDLFLGVQTREHEDIDILFLRRDQHEIRAQLQGCGMFKKRTRSSYPVRGPSRNGNRTRF